MEALILVDQLNEIEADHEAAQVARCLRDSSNPFSRSETAFRKEFRLSRDAVRYVIEQLTPHAEEAIRSTRLTLAQSVLCAIRFFSFGSYQKNVTTEVLPMSKSSVSRSIKLTYTLMMQVLGDTWLKFPSLQDMPQKKQEFLNDGLPNIIALVDGTHVAIVKPSVREDAYFNRKHYHSINVQIVCDAKKRILSINARYPGRTHDSFIWHNSSPCDIMRQHYANGARGNFILGDQGYPSQPWLLTPVRNAARGTAEYRYNQEHKRVRSKVERCIGLLKGRFRCLLSDRVLHYKPEAAAKIIYACAILHNIGIQFMGTDDLENLDEIDQLPPEDVRGQPLDAAVCRRLGELVRRRYIQRYFNN